VFCLNSQEDPTEAEDDAIEDRMNRHNEIRKHLRNSFASIQVWGVPPPAESFSDTKGMKVAATQKAFKEKIAEIKATIGIQLRLPHKLHGQVMTGPVISSMVPRIVEALEEGAKVLSPPSILDAVHQQEAIAGISRAMAAFRAQIEPLTLLPDEETMDEAAFNRR
jgi:hypothetical protein